MARTGLKSVSDPNYPDRKAHASLADVEGRLLDGMRRSYPGLVDPDGSCPQCIALEYMLADANQAHTAASELTNS